MLNVLDLFAGGGGLSEGFRQAGFNIIAHIEMNKSACNTLRTREAFYYLKNNNKLNIYYKYLKKQISQKDLYSKIPQIYLDKVIESEISEDTFKSIIRSINHNLANQSKNKIDIIIGGPPCQTFSTVGRARDPNGMKDDPRNYLYKYYVNFIKEYRPKYFVFENVKGILSAINGKIFSNLIKDLISLNYNVEYKILNAADFGVPQTRERVFIMGWDANKNYKYPSFEKVREPFTIKDLFKDLPKIKAGESIDGEKKYLTSRSPHPFIRPNNWDILTQHISRPNNQRDLAIYKLIVETWNREKRLLKYNELPKEYQTHKNIKSFLDRFKLVRYELPSHTIVAHIAKDGHYYIHPDIVQNRSLSVREAARIQTFPDDYYFEDSRTSAFTQIGNAVPPLMAYKIAQQIKKIMAK